MLPSDFPKHFDVIISIEVLEHMTVEEGEKALEQLCQLTDTFVFSSSDSELKDVTHINVQRKEYWARIFAKQGFFRDVQVPPAYISECADVYRKRNDIYNVIQEYEVILRSEKLRKETKKVAALIYYDTGRGLNEEEKIIVDCEINSDSSILFSFELPDNVKAFRYDPAHTPCILSEMEIISGTKKLEANPVNATVYQGTWFFSTSGPQIMVQTEEKQITIKGKLLLLDNEKYVLYQLQQEKLSEISDATEKNKNEFSLSFLELGKRLELLISEKEKQIEKIHSEKENVQAELQVSKQLLAERREQIEKAHVTIENMQNELQQEKAACAELLKQQKALSDELALSKETCNAYQDAFFWKITKPARKLVGGIRKLGFKIKNTVVVRNVRKGMVSLKTRGIRKTFDKVAAYFARKKKIKVFGEGFELSAEARERQEKAVFKKDITFSILVPLYNTPVIFLAEMIDSVVKQTYSKWELCLADGSDAAHKEVEAYCKKCQKADARIKYRKLERNGGISKNTNACIDMAEGEYIGLFDHDDLLHPTALYEVMCAIEKDNPDFLYTDEVVFEGNVKNIVTAHFKPDYAIDTLRANNYICHFSVFRRSLLEKAGRFRSEYDGSQDHDLVLRLTNIAKKVCHIPKVLYYWRSHPASVASDVKSKPYVGEAGRKAVQASIEAGGEKAIVESSEFFPAIYRVKYKITGNPMISIVIQCQDRYEEIERCVNSIISVSTYKNYEIVLVDDNSREHETFEYYKQVHKKYKNKVRILHWRKSYNYAAVNNYAVQQANGAYIILLHSDTVVISPEWMEELLMYAQRRDVGAVGAKLYYENDTVRHAGMILGMGKEGIVGYMHAGVSKDNYGYMGRLYYAQNVSVVSSSCMMVSKAVFQKLGGFDEDYKIQYSDADFCMKARRAGYLNVFNPYVELYHFKQGKSSAFELDRQQKEQLQQEDIATFKNRWGKELEQGDPYFNPNFDLNRNDFAIRNN